MLVTRSGPTVASDMKPPAIIDGRLSPGIALVLLETLREIDTPRDVLANESFRISLPRRLGLSDVVERQMRRYADMRRRNRQLEAAEFLDLLRLVARRPDARHVFGTAGTRLGSAYAGRAPRIGSLARRLAPPSLRWRAQARHLRRVAAALNPGSSIRSNAGEASLSLDRCLTAAADDSGSACELVTAAFLACMEELGQRGSVEHPSCESKGDDACRWTVRPES